METKTNIWSKALFLNWVVLYPLWLLIIMNTTVLQIGLVYSSYNTPTNNSIPREKSSKKEWLDHTIGIKVSYIKRADELKATRSDWNNLTVV